MKVLRNTWYVAALSKEVVQGSLFRRMLFGDQVVLYRTGNGAPVALFDRCPHRFVPLSMGRQVGDDVVCHYHGLRFDCSGRCVHNPHGDGTIPRKMVVRGYPVVERFGFVWIWPGDSEAADPDLIPDYSILCEGPDSGVGYGHMRFECNYKLMADNIMDLSHVDYIHGPIIHTRGKLSPIKPALSVHGNEVVTRWEWEQGPALGLFNDFLPRPGDSARHFLRVSWRPACNMLVHVGATQSETGFEDALQSHDYHLMTPETAASTHYFLASRRNYMVESEEYNDGKLNGMMQAFIEEDAPVVTAIQKEMGDRSMDEMQPVYLSGDPGPVRCRRILDGLVREEEQVRASSGSKSAAAISA